jgi:hypothetical protein
MITPVGFFRQPREHVFLRHDALRQRLLELRHVGYCANIELNKASALGKTE